MEIRFSRSAHCCHATGRNFVHDEEIYSVVRIEEGALVREDYCAEAWKPELAQGVYSAWSAKFYDPKVAEQAPPEVFSPLRQTFYESLESEERPELARAYLAAQLLRRQKVFRRIKEADESEGETRITLYADRIGNRLIEVRDPNFSYAELDAARNALLDRLQALENPAPVPEAEPQSESEPESEPAPGFGAVEETSEQEHVDAEEKHDE